MLSKLIILTFFVAVSSGVRLVSMEPLSFTIPNRGISMPYRLPGQPLKITLSVHVIHFSVNTGKQEYDLTMYFRQEWKDPRLSFESSDPLEYRVIDEPNSIWTPDLFFVNEIASEPQTPSKSNSFIRLYPDGKIFTSQKLTIKAICPMNLMSYPFDTQNCELIIESYSHTANDLITEWNRSSEYSVTGNANAYGFDSKMKWRSTLVEFKGNEYGRSVIEFHLRRNATSIVIHVIIPIITLVLCSWVSFFFNRKLMFIRLTLCLLPIITHLLLLNFGTIFLDLPAYLTGLDVWVSFCFLSMFGAFFECIYVLCMAEKSISKRETEAGLVERSEKVDLRARIAFACSFITFNVFCAVFVSLSDDF